MYVMKRSGGVRTGVLHQGVRTRHLYALSTPASMPLARYRSAAEEGAEPGRKRYVGAPLAPSLSQSLRVSEKAPRVSAPRRRDAHNLG